MDEIQPTENTTDTTTPTAEQTVVEPVAPPTEPTALPASTGEPEVANVPVIQIDTPPAPQIIEREVIGVSSGEREPASGPQAQDSLRSFPGPNEWTAPVKEVIKEVPVDRIVEKEVIREVIKEVPVEKIVYKEGEITPASFRAYLKDFLHRVGPRGRAMQHERAQKKRADTLKLFDTHQQVTHKLVMDTLHFSDREASRVLSDLRAAGKIVIHEPARHGAKSHHGGRGTFYTKTPNTP